MTNTPAPAPATDEQLADAIERGLAVGTLVAFEDVDWDDPALADRAPVDPYLARYGTPEQHDPATCGVCATLPRPAAAAPFCEAAAEWDHDWRTDDAGRTVCGECGEVAAS